MTTPDIEVDDDLLNGFLDESLDLLSEVDAMIVGLESAEDISDTVNAIFRPVHSIKGNAPFFGYTKLRNLAHEMETLLAMVREGALGINKSLISVLLEGTDELRAMLERAREREPEVIDEKKYSTLLQKVIDQQSASGDDEHYWIDVFQKLQHVRDEIQSDELKESVGNVIELLEKLSGHDEEAESEEVEAPAVEAAAEDATEGSESQEAAEPKEKQETSESKSTKTESGKTMRVAEEHIDTFLSYVGELLILGEMLVYLERRMSSIGVQNEITSEFNRVIEAFSMLSDNLQKSLMSIRKVPVKTALRKVPRLVRDIANDKKKEIEVVTVGENVEVDKSLLEMLDAPLTHMVRNSADHGIEMPDVREEAGKPREGTVTVSFEETDKYIVLKVTDDGAGLNYDAIQKKAQSLGLVQEGKQLTQAQIVDFLFAAGVSTAEKVTDVSGRGVGMDVVKRSIEQAGGGIHVTSTPGEGTVFTVELVKAVTTHIIEGLVFEVDDRFFIVPIEQVTEAFSCTSDEIFNATGKDSYIYRQNVALPIVPAAQILSVSEEEESESDDSRIIISVKANRRPSALLVDAVVGVQQVVVKKISNLKCDGDYYVGGALIGDGKIALVLDLDKFCEGYDLEQLAERARRVDMSTYEDNHHETENAKDKQRETLLLAHIEEDRRVAIPLAEINRLEKVEISALEAAGGKAAIQYRDTILPVVNASSHEAVGQEESDEELQLDVIICGEEQSMVGIIVDEILDIVDEELACERVGHEKGIRCTTVVQEKVTDIIDVDSFIESHVEPFVASTAGDSSNVTSRT